MCFLSVFSNIHSSTPQMKILHPAIFYTHLSLLGWGVCWCTSASQPNSSYWADIKFQKSSINNVTTGKLNKLPFGYTMVLITKQYKRQYMQWSNKIFHNLAVISRSYTLKNALTPLARLLLRMYVSMITVSHVINPEGGKLLL